MRHSCATLNPDQPNARSPERAQRPCVFFLTLTYMEVGYASMCPTPRDAFRQKERNERFTSMWLRISVWVIPERLLGTNQCGRKGSAVNLTKISQSQAGSQCLYIAHRWLPEEPLVLPIELAWTLVSNLEGCARSV